MAQIFSPTDTHGTIAAANTPQQLFPALSTGTNFLIQNTNPTGNLYLDCGDAASATSLSLAPGEKYICPYRTSKAASIMGATLGMTFYMETW